MIKKESSTFQNGFRLASPVNSPHPYQAVIKEFSGNRKSAYAFQITGPGKGGQSITKKYRLPRKDHKSYIDLQFRIARDFGLRIPINRRPLPRPTFEADYEVLLDRNLNSEILYGYGDPAVLRVEGGDIGESGEWYCMVATSNDARQSFPILRSSDLRDWDFVAFAFPEHNKPAWAAEGETTADYWAPELHKVGGEYRLYFVARLKGSRELCIGVAKAERPGGPFVSADAPLLRGGVIDPHVFVEGNGTSFLYWKEDNNDKWRNSINALLFEYPELITELFEEVDDQKAVSFVAALWPWTKTLEPMERFFQQYLIEAISSNFSTVEQRLLILLEKSSTGQAQRNLINQVLPTLKTPVYVSELSRDGLSLVGGRTKVLENDQTWEAHVVEGVWVVKNNRKYYMFYAGNDFQTADYGIGVATADGPTGPFIKSPKPFLQTTGRWLGPGHPSAAVGPDGEHILFVHAFRPGEAGYKQFRALLAIEISFEDDLPKAKSLSRDLTPVGP
jgi:hypothetical protein